MTKDEFVNKNGNIIILEDQNKYFSRLTHPAKINGTWEKGTGKGQPLFGGNFYTTGYYPSSKKPDDDGLNWEALDYENSFLNKAVKLLRSHNCRTLQSEGDGTFFPFIWTGLLEINELPDDNELGILAPKEVGLAYKNDEIPSKYSNLPVFYDLMERNNIFWDDEFEEEVTAGMTPEAKNAFAEVSDMFKNELPVISLIQYYPDYIEFPAVIGGKDKFGHFIGLITSMIWS